jgi:outer membrane protein OmpA-like peptidoglycan-associated protein
MAKGGDGSPDRARWIAFVATTVAAAVVVPGVASSYDSDGVPERIFEVHALGGVFIPDDNVFYKTSPMLGLRGTLNNSVWWGVEMDLSIAPAQSQSFGLGMLRSYNPHVVLNTDGIPIGVVITQMDTEERTGRTSTNLFMFGGNVIVNLTDGRIRPFLTLGGGFIDDLGNSDENPAGPFSNGYVQFGAGVKYHFKSGWRPGWGIRLDVRDLVMSKDDLPRAAANAPLIAGQFDIVSGGGADGVLGQEPYDPFEHRGKRWLNNWGITIAVTAPLGWVWKDGDGDLVADRFDQCLTTAPGVVVDARGCGIDTDVDGVFDGLDQCPATPRGATVDLAGCPSDIDGDGVLDGIDLMNDTPTGARVDAQGRHFDTDADGVFDGLDLCEDTPPGASIDLDGCSQNPLEDQLLRGETIVLTGVEFEPGTDEIEPLSFHYVNRIGRLLEHWTGNEEAPRRVEVGVHTDGVGAEDFNLDLSQRRADRLRIYLLENFFGMAQNNLVATGYGQSMPLATDDTEEGRSQNRRVEIRSLGPGGPPEQYDWGAGDFDELEAPRIPTESLDEPVDLLDEVPDEPLPDAPDATETPDLIVPPEPEMPTLPEEPEMPTPDID